MRKSQYGYTVKELEVMRIEHLAALEREAEVKAVYRAGVERAVKDVMDRAEFDGWVKAQLALSEEYEKMLAAHSIGARFENVDPNKKVMTRKDR